MKKRNSYEFFRWGTLSPQDHKEGSLPGDSPFRGFHTAPVRKGFYAFPKGYIETFLLGKSPKDMIPGKEGNGRFFYLRDLTGKKIIRDKYYNLRPDEKTAILRRVGIKEVQVDFCYTGDDDYSDDQKFIAVYSPRPKRFVYTGPYIWHHLRNYDNNKPLVNSSDIIAEKGSWIKTTLDVWWRALKKSDTIYRWKSYINRGKGNRHGNPHTCPSWYCKDDYEVFIERI